MNRDSLSYLPEGLAYALRRYRFILTNRGQYRKFSQLRRGYSAEGYTLRPFDDLKCIFIHVPKCAGQSIRATLFEDLQPGHIQAYTYQLVFPRRLYQSYFKFTFVRNPWDRLVSAYLFMSAGGAHQKDRLWAEQKLAEFASFEDFVKNGLVRDDIQAWPHFKPQSRFLTGQNGRIELDFIGRFENIQQDFAHVRSVLGSTRDLLFVNKTKTKKQHYHSYYSAELREIAARVYAEDIQAFGYTFNTEKP